MTRNVVLVCLDTVRKDYFDKCADTLTDLSATTFSECRAASSWSVPSHGSMLTGALPHQHGCHTYDMGFTSLQETSTVLDALPEHTAIGISANVYASPAYGFDSLFDEFTYISPGNRFPDGLGAGEFFHQWDGDSGMMAIEFLKAAIRHPHPVQSFANGVYKKTLDVCSKLPFRRPVDDGARAVNHAAKKAAANAEEPFVMFLNYMDAHGPLTNLRAYEQSELGAVPATWSSSGLPVLEMNLEDRFDEFAADLEIYRQLYEAAIRYLDGVVAELIAELQKDTSRESTIVVTADHGENLAETTDPPRFGHVTPNLTEALLHVPLEVINPPADLSVQPAALFSHLQLRDLVTAIATESGTSLEPGPVGAEVGGIGVVHHPTDDPDFEAWNRTRRCLYVDGTKRVWDDTGDEAFYRIDGTDACCAEPIDGENLDADLADELFETSIGPFAECIRSQQGPPQKLDPTTKTRLDDLGYV